MSFISRFQSYFMGSRTNTPETVAPEPAEAEPAVATGGSQEDRDLQRALKASMLTFNAEQSRAKQEVQFEATPFNGKTTEGALPLSVRVANFKGKLNESRPDRELEKAQSVAAEFFRKNPPLPDGQPLAVLAGPPASDDES